MLGDATAERIERPALSRAGARSEVASSFSFPVRAVAIFAPYGTIRT